MKVTAASSGLSADETIASIADIPHLSSHNSAFSVLDHTVIRIREVGTLITYTE